MSTDYGVKYKTAREGLLDVLWDLDWHSWKALREVGGVRYSARLLEMKREGYNLEDRGDTRTGHGKEYRLKSHIRSTPKGKSVKVYLSEPDVIALLEDHTTDTARSAIRDALGSFQRNRDKL